MQHFKDLYDHVRVKMFPFLSEKYVSRHLLGVVLKYCTKKTLLYGEFISRTAEVDDVFKDELYLYI